MASKPKPFNPLNGMHTAGIFSDMSIDGPEIGTLVVVVDRAKNLPNRKTIGNKTLILLPVSARKPRKPPQISEADRPQNGMCMNLPPSPGSDSRRSPPHPSN